MSLLLRRIMVGQAQQSFSGGNVAAEYPGLLCLWRRDRLRLQVAGAAVRHACRAGEIGRGGKRHIARKADQDKVAVAENGVHARLLEVDGWVTSA
ncbi:MULTISPECIES: hypothetical protein [unclassified Janthinobacterium]|uniref:hypothetical protein n=1 Tax=unclassified Janthinobacterium TaxID=2610881 RepID=UPI0011135F3E|nr:MULTISPECIES: hypothetical protein [unclassified Janthinobacterium]